MAIAIFAKLINHICYLFNKTVKLKIQKIGDSLGVSIPHEILEQMNVAEGDSIYVVQTPDGIYLTTEDPEFKTVMETARNISDRYCNAMKELAK